MTSPYAPTLEAIRRARTLLADAGYTTASINLREVAESLDSDGDEEECFAKLASITGYLITQGVNDWSRPDRAAYMRAMRAAAILADGIATQADPVGL